MKTLLVINAGSSSIKFALFSAEAAPRRLVRGQVDGLRSRPRMTIRDSDGRPLVDETLPDPTAPAATVAPDRAAPASATSHDRPAAPAAADHPDHDRALAALLGWLDTNRRDDELLAVGHRIVHGGERFIEPVAVTPQVLAELETLAPLAPLHQPHNLAAIRAVDRLHPQLSQVACFDTSFHATQPWLARAYALPRNLTDAGIRRYGFHGLSYEYLAGVLPEHLAALADGRVVIAHLGNGASLCALDRRRSVATTMGFTALDGLMMGTRCGSLDPGVVLYLMTGLGMPVDEVQALLNERSGLLGVSGISSDLRVLEASDDPHADDAIALFTYRIARELGSMAAALGGLDALVFTAGIGEHSALVREQVCRQAAWLGIEIDEAANHASASRISSPGSPVTVAVIPTDEELAIVRHVQAVLSRGNGADRTAKA